jgi:hypothetical protein
MEERQLQKDIFLANLGTLLLKMYLIDSSRYDPRWPLMTLKN